MTLLRLLFSLFFGLDCLIFLRFPSLRPVPHRLLGHPFGALWPGTGDGLGVGLVGGLFGESAMSQLLRDFSVRFGDSDGFEEKLFDSTQTAVNVVAVLLEFREPFLERFAGFERFDVDGVHFVFDECDGAAKS